ncbi:MAG: hypothetical protein EOO75_18645, partial [Myxococcales bacterium]
MPRVRFSAHSPRATRNHQGLMWVGCLLAAVMAASMSWVMAVPDHLMLPLVVQLWLASMIGRRESTTAAGVQIEEGRLLLQGERLRYSTRGRPWQAGLDPHRGQVVLRGTWGDEIRLALAPDDLAPCLEALGAQGPGQATFWLGDWTLPWLLRLLWLPLLVVVWVLGREGSGASVLLAAVPGVSALSLWLAARRPVRLQIGADGVNIERWRSSRFVPFRDVALREVDSSGL